MPIISSILEEDLADGTASSPPVIFAFPMLNKAPVILSEKQTEDDTERIRDSLYQGGKVSFEDVEAGLNEKETPTWQDSNPLHSRFAFIAVFFSRIGGLFLSFFASLKYYFLNFSDTVSYRLHIAKESIRNSMQTTAQRRKHVHASRSNTPLAVPELIVSAVEGIDIVTVQAPLVGDIESKIEYQVSGF
jgi:hypothetical protein